MKLECSMEFAVRSPAGCRFRRFRRDCWFRRSKCSARKNLRRRRRPCLLHRQTNNGVGMRATVKIVIGLLAVLLPVCAQEKDDVVMKAMSDELARSVSQLRVTDLEKPYFISYRVDDVNSAIVSATLGSVTLSNPVRTRVIGVEVRVGDYAFDNSNFVTAQSARSMSAGVLQGPLDDDYQQIRRQLWLATDAQYKHVAEEFSAKKAALANRKRTTDVADFSKESPATVRESYA